jgi:hypothetical protein
VTAIREDKPELLSVLWIWNGENGQLVRNLSAPKPESAEVSQQPSK